MNPQPAYGLLPAQAPEHMENYLWILWAVLGAVLIVAEIFTTGFVLLWFGIGALVAGLAALLGVNNIILQFLIFAVVSIALTAASRTIFRTDGASKYCTLRPMPYISSFSVIAPTNL